MTIPNLHKNEQRPIQGRIIVALTLYISTIIVLIALVYNFNSAEPQIDAIHLTPSPPSLEVTGKNLGSDARATYLYRNTFCSNIVAKKFMWERVFDVKVKGSIAWALCRNVGLVALDISDPHQPEIIHTLHIDKFLWHLKIEGNTAYIACGKDGMVVCDISSPLNARIIYEHTSPYHTTDITSAQNLLYISNGKHGIRVIDPDAGEIVQHIKVPGTVLRLHATRDRLFTFSQYAGHGYLHIFSIEEDPIYPRPLQHLQFSGTPRDYVFKDSWLFLANGKSGIGVVKLNDDSTATFRSAPDMPLRTQRLALFGDQLVVFSRTGDIALYSIDENGNLTLESTGNTCSRVFGADIFGKYAVIATNAQGISIIDLSISRGPDPASIVAQLSPLYDTSGWRATPSGICIVDAKKLYYLKHMSDGELVQTGELIYPATGILHAYSIGHNRIYAAFKNSVLYVGKILPDGTLLLGEKAEVASHPTGNLYALEIHKDNLYLCTSNGLKVFDISNPDKPRYLPSQDIPGNIRSITFARGVAYMASFGHGIKIAPMTSDNKLGAAETMDFPRHLISGAKSLDITYADGFLFAACGYRGLLIIDVRNPHQPVVVDSIELSGYCKKVELRNGVLGAQSQDSLYLFDAEDPEYTRMVGRLEDITDFYLENEAILYLQRTKIFRTPFPEDLQIGHKSESSLTIQLPADTPAKSYNVFLNLGKKHSKLIGTLVNRASGAAGSAWEFARNNADE